MGLIGVALKQGIGGARLAGKGLISKNVGVAMATRTAVGAGIGAAAGYATSDSNNPTNLLMDTLRGAALGGIAGAGTSAITHGLPKAANVSGFKEAYRLKDLGAKTAKALDKGTAMPIKYGPLTRGESAASSFREQFRKAPLTRGTKFAAGEIAGNARHVANFVGKNPRLAAGIAVGAVGGAAALTTLPGESSPTMGGAEVNTRYDQQAMSAMQMRSGIGAPGAGAFGSAPEMMTRFHRAHQASTAGLVQGLHRGRHG